MEIYDYNNRNSSSKFRHPKFISFFIHNGLDHSGQLIKVGIIIPNIFNDTKINNDLSLLIKTYNHNNSNSGITPNILNLSVFLSK